MNKITVVSSSMRTKGNSTILCESFIKGAKESGNEINYISLQELDLKYCLGCLNCQKTGNCVIKDSVSSLLDDISSSDVIVFATPIYYYSMAGQLKTFLDRLNPLFRRENKFKEVYILCSCADSDISASDVVKKEIEGWAVCFNGVKVKDLICATSTTTVGQAKGSQAEEDAYLLGKKIR